jgi:hypothetical protein
MMALASLALAEDEQRRLLDSLSEGERRQFFEMEAGGHRDATVFALLCLSGGLGLQQFYLGRWRQLVLGWALLAASVALFFASLFQASGSYFLLSFGLGLGVNVWGWGHAFFAGHLVREENLKRRRAILETLRWQS